MRECAREREGERLCVKLERSNREKEEKLKSEICLNKKILNENAGSLR